MPAPRLDCTSYCAGHTVHWIQALHVANKPHVRAESIVGWIVDIRASTVALAAGVKGVREICGQLLTSFFWG